VERGLAVVERKRVALGKEAVAAVMGLEAGERLRVGAEMAWVVVEMARMEVATLVAEVERNWERCLRWRSPCCSIFSVNPFTVTEISTFVITSL